MDPLPSISKLSSSQFDKSGNLPNAKGITYILFYSTGCGHCKQFAPMYTQFAQQNKGKANFFGLNSSVDTGLYNIKFPFPMNGVPVTGIYINDQPSGYIVGNNPSKLSVSLNDTFNKMRQ